MLENNPLDPRTNSSNEEEVANTPSDNGKKTDDGILGDLDFWQNRYSDKKTKYEQISLVDTIETSDVLTDDFAEDYVQTSFDGFEDKPITRRRMSKSEKDELDFLLADAERLISHYDDKPKAKEEEKASPEIEKEEHADDIPVNEEPSVAVPDEAVDDTAEEIPDDVPVEEAPEEGVIEDTSTDIPVDEATAEGVIEDTSTDIPVDEATEEEAVEETSTDAAVDEAIEEDTIEETSADVPVDEVPEKESVEDTSTDVSVDEATEEDAIEDTSIDAPVDEPVEENVTEDNSTEATYDEITQEASDESAEDEPQKLTLISNPAEEAKEEVKEENEEEITPKRKKKEKKQREKEEKEEAQPQIISEYTDPAQRDIILRGLKSSLSHMNAVKAAINVTFVISLIVTLIPLTFKLLSLDIPSFDTVGTIILNVINIVLLAVSVSFASQSFISGLMGFKRGITAHTVSSVTVILALIQSVSTIFAIGNSPIISYSYISVAIFSLLLNISAEQKNIRRIITCFDFCAYTQADALYSIREIEGAEDSASVGKSLDMNDPHILYSGKIDFATDFLRGCKSSGVSSKIIKRNLALSIVLSLIIAGLTSFLNQNIFVIFAVFTGTFCLTSPFAVLLSLSSTLLNANKSLSLDGGIILSYPAAQKCAQADAVAVDCADLFCRSRCEIKDIKGTGAVRADDVLLYSVAMILQSGGPLSEVFNSIIGGNRDMLPRVQRLKYEDKMGLSAKIYGHNILLGSRAMMDKNNIQLPNIDEVKYNKNGYKLLYMSVDSVFAAFFVLKYQEDKTLHDSLNEIQNRGIKLVMRTDDPNVTNEYIADCFKLNKNYVKSTCDSGSSALRWYRNSLKDSDCAAVLHDGNPYSYFRTVVLCHRLRKFAGNIKTFALLLTLLLCAAATAALFTESWIIFSPLAIILIHSISIAFATMIQKMKI